MYEVTVKRSFSAAHVLAEAGGGCENLHGHNFTVEVSASARELNAQGLAVDFRVLKRWTEDVLQELDHKYLNDVPYFKASSPSSEHIARFIYERIADKAQGEPFVLSCVTVWESESSRVSYRADQHD
ncbi:MAG: 6-carboxytetrahydropterin synthase QueD [Deltaproteobacteria bacterium]|nr:6-carboxytetrahydropterin synthase QueD [Deltaproteobacteria bacterium]